MRYLGSGIALAFLLLLGASAMQYARAVRPVELPPRVKRNQYYELTADETQRLLDWLDAAQLQSPPKDAPGRGARE